MKTTSHHITTSGLFLSILLLFIFGTSNNAFGQTTEPFTATTLGWTVPAGVFSITVECWGAGGGGATITNATGGGGGGGGGYAKHTFAVLPGETYDIIVGTGGGPGLDGGDSTFDGVRVVAAGGSGVATDVNNGSSGGSTNTGNIVTYAGGNGGNGLSSKSKSSGGGGGGAGSTGPGGNSTSSTGGTGTTLNGGNGGDGTTGSGLDGSTYGGGGGGAGKNNGTGGSGANGYITVTYTAAAGCSLSDSGLVILACDNKGTLSDSSDDEFSFKLNPSGSGIGASYNFTGTVSGSGSYGSETTFGPYLISDGDLNITITDVDDGGCQILETITAPASCSTPVCNLTATGLASITCDDAGTPAIIGDDTFSFTLNPTGTDLGTTYNVSGAIIRNNISYGSAELFNLNDISLGDLTLTITDVSTNCTIANFVVTAPAPCSVACNLTGSGLSNLFCNDQGTLSDPTDDTFTFTINPTGGGLSGNYNVSGDIIRNNISYGADELFGPFLISGGDKTITVTDVVDGTCQIIGIVAAAPGSCSHSFTECSSCHILHGSPGVSLTNVTGNALLCQSCHADGGLATNKPLVDGSKAIPGVSGNSHAWDVSADNSSYQTTVPDPSSPMGQRLPGGNIVCSTCHDQHNSSAGSPYLRLDNTGDVMCKVCHEIRDVGKYVDDNVNHRGSHPVGITYPVASSNYQPTPLDPALKTPGGKVECSSCHALHDVTGALALTNDGNLLRVTNDINLCGDCHTYTGHQGFDCKDCHEIHNTVDGIIGNNIFSIKDIVNGSPVVFTAQTGPNSYVDSDGTFDGICEVCHTSTTHHLSDGSGTTHNDASDKRGQSCVSCHFHNADFATPSGPLSCLDCHSSVQSGARGGTVQIVGGGTEFDPLNLSRHSATDPTNAECEACHYESVGNHPTTEMMLRDPGADATWSGDVDVYCIKCHDGTPPVGTTFPGNDPIYNKSTYIGTPHDTSTNSCQQCHTSNHGSANENLLPQSTNYLGCRDCHDGLTASSDIDSLDKANPIGGTGNGHAFDVLANSGDYETVSPTDPAMTARLDASGNIVCSTCHDPHDNTYTKLLVNDNSSDGLCKDCHAPRDKGAYATDNVNNRGSHPVGIAYPATADYNAGHTLPLVGGNVECSSCHGVHNTVTNDGNLLKMTNDNNLCKDCHTYGLHDGMDCLDCHEAHESSGNILLVKSVITTPNSGDKAVVYTSRTGTNSGADGDTNYNGVCEVCHTQPAASNHLNNAPPDPTDSDHYSGQDCIGCHPHSANFAPQGGDCTGCHQTSFPGWKITDSHFAHSDKYAFSCDECHIGNNHNNGTVDLAFDPNGVVTRNGADGNTPVYNGDKTCDNIYCHSNGITAQRGLGAGGDWTGGAAISGPGMIYPTTPAWTVPVNTINTCFSCHPGVGNMTAPYIIEAPGMAEEVTNYPQTGQHIKGSHMSNSQEFKSIPSKATPWGSVQCFFCHSVGAYSGPIDPAAPGVNIQGSYGYNNMEFHVDGETLFNPLEVLSGGTMIDGYGRSGTGGHCGTGVSCWE